MGAVTDVRNVVLHVGDDSQIMMGYGRMGDAGGLSVPTANSRTQTTKQCCTQGHPRLQ
jgi:hypothetical protein